MCKSKGEACQHNQTWKLSDYAVNRAVAIVVCSEEVKDNKTNNPDALAITVAAGDNGRFTLYEDDGESFAYKNGDYVCTDFYLDYSECGEFYIQAGKGNLSFIPDKRQYKIRFLGFEMTGPIVEIIDGTEVELSYEYHESKNEIMVSVESSVEEEIRIRFTGGMKVKRNNVEQLCFHVLDKAGISYILKEEIYEKIKEMKREYKLNALKEMIVDVDLYGALAEIINAQGE